MAVLAMKGRLPTSRYRRRELRLGSALRALPDSDLGRWTASEPTSSLPTGPDPYTPMRPCYNFENETLK